MGQISGGELLVRTLRQAGVESCSGCTVPILIRSSRPASTTFASGRPACLNVEIDLAPIPPELYLLMKR